MMKHWLSKKYWADKDVEILMGTLLRFGVIFSGIVVIAARVYDRVYLWAPHNGKYI